MGKFKNPANGVVVSVDDSKDDRYSGWEAVSSGSADSGSTDSGDEGYNAFTVAELKAEIASRNEGRDEQLSDEGKKADLVATLEADDNK